MNRGWDKRLREVYAQFSVSKPMKTKTKIRRFSNAKLQKSSSVNVKILKYRWWPQIGICGMLNQFMIFNTSTVHRAPAKNILPNKNFWKKCVNQKKCSIIVEMQRQKRKIMKYFCLFLVFLVKIPLRKWSFGKHPEAESFF